MRKFYIVIFVVLAFFVQTNAQSEKKTFRGIIGTKQIQLTLTRTGNKLSGTYFYQSTGKDVRLSGTIDAEGNFKLEEFDAANVKTGEFKGTWLKASDNTAYLAGEWTLLKDDETIILNLGEEMVFFTGATKLVNKNFSEKNRQRKFRIMADYPELTGVSPAVAANFNKLIKDSVMKEVDAFRKQMLTMSDEDMKFFKENNAEAFFETGYMIYYANDKVISIGFGNSVHMGGAHPAYYSFAVNFDLVTGKKIELADLFKPNSNYLKAISDYCIKKLKEQQADFADDEQIAAGAGAKEENFKSWNIRKSGILIIFEPYQVAPGAAGAPEVFIPYSDLKSILRADSVVLSL